MANKKSKKEKITKSEDVRKLVTARLSVLSPDTIISIGSDGSYSRNEAIDHVNKGDKVGEKIAQVEIEWLRSFKNN